jgi:Fic-DOC domain mobile mystery protein B
MTGRLFPPADGATPLTQEEERDLAVGVTNRAELNAFERENILEARRWALGKRTLTREDLLSEDFLRELHRRMFRRVWRWAGKYRSSERNLGVAVHQLPQALRLLLDDTRYWFSEKTYPTDEAAVRFHHRLVAIHPWPNGNGRHARLMADTLISRYGGPPLTWGASDGAALPGTTRQRYLDSLRAADNGNIQPLLVFARGGKPGHHPVGISRIIQAAGEAGRSGLR